MTQKDVCVKHVYFACIVHWTHIVLTQTILTTDDYAIGHHSQVTSLCEGQHEE